MRNRHASVVLVAGLMLVGCGDGGGGDSSDAGVGTDAGAMMITVATPQDAVGGHEVHMHAEVSGGVGGHSLAWTQTSGSSVSLQDKNTANPSFTAPVASSPEALVFEVEARDTVGQRISDTVTVNVVPSILAASAGSDISSEDGRTVSLHAAASGDLDGVTYEWTQLPSLASATITDSSDPNTTVDLPVVMTPIMLTFEVKATNASGVESTDQMNISVEPTQILVQAGADNMDAFDHQIVEGGVMVMQANASGGLGALTYLWTIITDPSPGGSSIVLTQADTLTPSFGTAGVVGAMVTEADVVLRLTVTDAAGHSVSDDATIRVYASPPAPLTIPAVPNMFAMEGELLQLSTGANGGTPPYSVTWEQLNSPPDPSVGLTPVAGSNLVTFGAPAVDMNTLIALRVTVQDSGAGMNQQTQMADVFVTVQPRPLAVTAIDDFDSQAGHSVSLTAQAVDGEGPYTYAWSQPGGTMVTLTGADTANPSFTATTPAMAEDLTFEVLVTDSLMNTATDQVVVSVAAVPALSVTGSAASPVAAGSQLTLHAAGSGGVGTMGYTYRWEQTAGTSGTWAGTQDDENARIQLPVVSMDEDLSFAVTLTDTATGATATDTVVVNVLRPQNDFTTAERTQKACGDPGQCLSGQAGTLVCATDQVPILWFGFNRGTATYMVAGCVAASACQGDPMQNPSPTCLGMDLTNPPADFVGDCLLCCYGANCSDPVDGMTPTQDELLDCSDPDLGCCTAEATPRCVTAAAP